MKKAQAIIALFSLLLLSLAIILKHSSLLFVALVGICIAIVIKQIRINRKGTVLGHPERKRYKDYDSDREDDFIDIDSDVRSDN